MSDRGEELKRIPFHDPDPGSWPKHVKGIGFDEIGALGIDAQRQLYWNGQPIELRKTVTLTLWQKAATAAVSLSTVALAVVEVYKAITGK